MTLRFYKNGKRYDCYDSRLPAGCAVFLINVDTNRYRILFDGEKAASIDRDGEVVTPDNGGAWSLATAKKKAQIALNYNFLGKAGCISNERLLRITKTRVAMKTLAEIIEEKEKTKEEFEREARNLQYEIDSLLSKVLKLEEEINALSEAEEVLKREPK
jgi:hypothetical protein